MDKKQPPLGWILKEETVALYWIREEIRDSQPWADSSLDEKQPPLGWILKEETLTMWETASSCVGVGRDVASFKSVIEETLDFKTWFELSQNFENVILILKREDRVILKMKMDGHHWEIATSGGEVCKSWIKVPLGNLDCPYPPMAAGQELFGKKSP